MPKQKIIPQMFDVRPVDHTGDLDWKKITSVGKKDHKQTENHVSRQAHAYILGAAIASEKAPVLHDDSFDVNAALDSQAPIASQGYQQEAPQTTADQLWIREHREAFANEYFQDHHEPIVESKKRAQRKPRAVKKRAFQFAHGRGNSLFEALRKKMRRAPRFPEENAFSLKDLFYSPKFFFSFDRRQMLVSFACVALIFSLMIGSISFAAQGLMAKGRVLGVSQDGYANLNAAVSELSKQNFSASSAQFTEAYENFSQASQLLNDLGGVLVDATRYVPFASKLSSGKNAVEAGKHFSAAGQSLNNVVAQLAALKDSGTNIAGSDVSLLSVFQVAQKNIADAKNELDAAQKNVDAINVDDLPKDTQDKFILLKNKLPEIRAALAAFTTNSQIFIDLLGGYGPRKYLFLFQNNAEMRPTGGFIGSYGLLDIANGHVKKFFIDGIFNPDGQLKDKVVPPGPIQKISAAWSLHDSNWFPDFPASAQKAMQFYEKTGGPTTDGVIAFTPTVIQKLLTVTGPIEMPDYHVTLDADNFIEQTQYKVEVDYDKEENQPKKILADLAPMLLEKLLSSHDPEVLMKAAQIFVEGLNEKHILLHSENAQVQDIIKGQGWSGEMLPAEKDYLSVINTNINGFKTDAVIDEHIEHSARIQDDGSIIDTVTITRKHNGGNSSYEWFNKVNADYMRVYVPEGSQLLDVNGQTRETDQPPLDYDTLGFSRDSDVQEEESSITIDPKSGTRIYQENGKTVFANWTYVSPQETMSITYTYMLPFRLFQISVGGSRVDSYSLVAQKQSGSIGSALDSHITYPDTYEVKWHLPEGMSENDHELNLQAKLIDDIFEGVVFERK